MEHEIIRFADIKNIGDIKTEFERVQQQLGNSYYSGGGNRRKVKYQTREPKGYLTLTGFIQLLPLLDVAIRRRECDGIFFSDLDIGHIEHINKLLNSLLNNPLKSLDVNLMII